MASQQYAAWYASKRVSFFALNQTELVCLNFHSRRKLMSTANTKNVNGVDLQRLTETIGAVQADPSLAQFKFRASNEWVNGGHNRSTIRNFYGVGQEGTSRKTTFTFDADEPAALLGLDNGANPVEYLLHALAACMTTTMVYHAAARGITVESVESAFEGDLDLQGFLGLDENVRPGYETIRASFKVKADATPEQLEPLFKLSPVHDSVSRSVQIDAKVEMINS
jgi:uncharacterized OsmC-like protein